MRHRLLAEQAATPANASKPDNASKPAAAATLPAKVPNASVPPITPAKVVPKTCTKSEPESRM